MAWGRVSYRILVFVIKLISYFGLDMKFSVSRFSCWNFVLEKSVIPAECLQEGLGSYSFILQINSLMGLRLNRFWNSER